MTEGQIKKLYIIQILEVLKRYSDVDHPLMQKDIMDLMRREFGVECERKAVGRNIENLKDVGYDIEYDNGYYLVQRDFEESELRYLIDSILASRYIPTKQAKDLIEKLTRQSNIYFRDKVRHICNITNMDHQDTNELFFTIDVLSEAISQHFQVQFYYRKYNTEKKLVHTSTEKHLVNPYQIVLANGKYYLVGNVDKYPNVTHFRVERIWDIEMIPRQRKDPREVQELKTGFDLPKHMVEHVYMFSGPSIRILMRIENDIIGDVIDWFGSEIEIKPDAKNGNNSSLVTVRANENAMKYWAMQFGEKVVILEPDSLREKIKKALEIMNNHYRED
jgi:predicted DNA-binding transcriptional regulator YafY